MPKKILVMDDELDTLNMLAMTLRLSGYDVLPAETGAKAIQLAMQSNPDIAVLDVMMPDISGIDVLRTLKREMLKPPTAIFLSASVRPEDRQAGLEEGAFTYLVKPVLRQKLIDTIKQALAAQNV